MEKYDIICPTCHLHELLCRGVLDIHKCVYACVCMDVTTQKNAGINKWRVEKKESLIQMK